MWALTPFESDVANVSVVHASLSNAIQAAINGLYNGSVTVKAMVIDGTGNVGYGIPPTGTPTAGTLSITTGASGTVAPGTTVPAGTFYKESALFGFARIEANAAIDGEFNLNAISHPSPGVYTFTFNGQPANGGNRVAVAVTAFGGGVAPFVLFQVTLIGPVAGNLQVGVTAFDAHNAFTATDTGLSILVFGG